MSAILRRKIPVLPFLLPLPIMFIVKTGHLIVQQIILVASMVLSIVVVTTIPRVTLRTHLIVTTCLGPLSFVTSVIVLATPQKNVANLLDFYETMMCKLPTQYNHHKLLHLWQITPIFTVRLHHLGYLTLKHLTMSLPTLIISIPTQIMVVRMKYTSVMVQVCKSHTLVIPNSALHKNPLP